MSLAFSKTPKTGFVASRPIGVTHTLCYRESMCKIDVYFHQIDGLPVGIDFVLLDKETCIHAPNMAVIELNMAK